MNYYFKIYAPLIVDQEVNPINSNKFVFTFEQESGWTFFRTKLSQNVILFRQDYRDIRPLLENNKCTEFEFNVYNKSGDVLVYSGVFTYYSIVDFNEDSCTIEFKTVPNDAYRLFMNKWKDKKNILTVQQVYTARMTYTPDRESQTVNVPITSTYSIAGTPVILNVPGLENSSALFNVHSPGVGWRCIHSAGVIDDFNVTVFAGNTTVDYTSIYDLTFARDLLYQLNGTPAPDPATWTFVSTVNIGGILYDIYTKYITNNSHITSVPGTFIKNIGGTDYTLNVAFLHDDIDENNTVDFDRCRLLSDVIDFLLQGTNLTGHESQFFYDANNPITGIANKLTTLLIGQKSDFIYPIGSNPATRGEWSLEEMLITLRKMRIYWHIENDKLVLEHKVYYDHGLDYTTDQIGIDLVALGKLTQTNQYSIDFSRMVGRETFKWMESLFQDFYGVDVTYNTCLTDQNSSADNNITDISTDIYGVYNGGSTISDSGFVLLQTELNAGIYEIQNETGILIPLTQIPNAHLSWSAWHDRYVKPYGIIANGTVNNIAVTFGMAEKLKVQKEIIYNGYCSQFNPFELVKTQYGNGLIDTAELNIGTNSLTLTIRHDIQ